MTPESCLNGLQHSLSEIDGALTELAPQLRRKIHREVIKAEVDELLDQRNLVTKMMSELAINQMEGDFM